MISITKTFEPIKIIGMDVEASGPSGKGALKAIVLKLSTNADHQWCRRFDYMWSQHFYMMKRDARASGSRLTVDCMEDELADGLLDELKKVVAETNAAHQEAIEQANLEKAKQQAQAVAEKQRLAQLANKLDFD